MNTVAVRFQREGRMMEVEFVLASLYNHQTASGKKQINHQAGRVGELLFFRSIEKRMRAKLEAKDIPNIF